MLSVFSVSGNYTEWSQWSVCDKTCGGGQQVKTRVCIGARNGGLTCAQLGLGNATETQDCNTQPCPGEHI